MNNKLTFLLLISSIIHHSYGAISDKRLCIDEKCSVPISEAITLLPYPAGSKGMISFPPRAKVIIYSYEAGNNVDLWGAEYNGQRGYVSKKHVRETKILLKEKPTFLVDTELLQEKENSPVIIPEIQPNEAVAQEVVIDGTVIPADIIPTATTEKPMLNTALPEIEKKVANSNVEKPTGDVKSTESSYLSSFASAIMGNTEDEYENDENESIEEEKDDDDEEDETDSDATEGNTETVSGEKNDSKNVVEGAEATKTDIVNNPSASHNETVDDNSSNIDKVQDSYKKINVGKAESPIISVNKTDNEELATDKVNDFSKDSQGMQNDNKEVISQQENKSNLEMQRDNKENVKIQQDMNENIENNIKKQREEIIEATHEHNKEKEESTTTNNDITSTINSNLQNPENVQKIDQSVAKEDLGIKKVDEKAEIILKTEETKIKVNDQVKESESDEKDQILHDKSILINETNSLNESTKATDEALSKESKIEAPTRIETENLPNLKNSQKVADPKIAPESHFLYKNPRNSLNQESNNLPYLQNSNEPQKGIDNELQKTQNTYEKMAVDTSATNITSSSNVKQKMTNSASSVSSTSSDIVPDISKSETGPLLTTNSEKAQEKVNEDSKLNKDFSETNIKNSEQKSPSIEEAKPKENLSQSYGTLFSGENNKLIDSTNVTESKTEEMSSEKFIPFISDSKTSNPTGPEEKSTVEDNMHSHPQENIENLQEIASDMLNKTPDEEIDKEKGKDLNLAQENIESIVEDEDLNKEGWLSMFTQLFSSNPATSSPSDDPENENVYMEKNDDVLLSKMRSSCDVNSGQCPLEDKKHLMQEEKSFLDITLNYSDEIFATAIAAVSIVVFLLGFILIEKMRRERPLIKKINQLEKEMLVMIQENHQLSDIVHHANDTRIVNDNLNDESNKLVLELRQRLDEASEVRETLEGKIETLTKELESSDELGCEMDKVITELLASQEGIHNTMSNIEELQRQLVEQQSVINNLNKQLSDKSGENLDLRAELDINMKKVSELQSEVEKFILDISKVEDEKQEIVVNSKREIGQLQGSLSKLQSSGQVESAKYNKEIADLRNTVAETERKLNLKTKEYNLLRETLSNSDNDKSLIDYTSLKAEVQQLQQDNKGLRERATQDQVVIRNFEAQTEYARSELETLKQRYEEADKEKLEALTKLEVLSGYFKDKEADLQKELSKHESMWLQKKGEATSTTERLRFMQEEIQNYKSQLEILQQEIVQQEIELKSQISVLEKKAHEHWVAARQAERKVEDARQEAAQLRNRLTLRERSLIEEKSQNRLPPSSLEVNGELSPPPLLHPLHASMHAPGDSPASPLLLYGPRDHLSMPPFPPPPPGAPFLPPLPPLPFMPPLPNMHPGDPRPPPLGRMSSPPINPPFSPDSRYSPYEGNSPSPTDDEYYQHIPSYSPYDNNNRRRFRSPPPVERTQSRNKNTNLSSGSANSNESIEKVNRYHSKV